MNQINRLTLVLLAWTGLTGFTDASASPAAGATAAAKTGDWRALDPDWTLYLDLPGGRQMVIELAPQFAPANAGNVRALTRAQFYDGLSIYRVQDNYVVQMGHEPAPRPIPSGATATVKAEFVHKGLSDLAFTPLGYSDGYAPQTGFSNGFAAARDPKSGTAWLVHCYGAIGMSRDDAPDSGGTDFYVTIGQAPRHLDRNITVFGRVIVGMDHLATLQRGSMPLGFFRSQAMHVPIVSVRLASDLPEQMRRQIEVMRTDTPAWTAHVKARANRQERWFARPAGYVDVCNVPVPVREKR